MIVSCVFTREEQYPQQSCTLRHLYISRFGEPGAYEKRYMLRLAQLEALEADDGFRKETLLGLKKAFGDLCQAVRVLKLSEEGVREFVSAASNRRQGRQEFASLCVHILTRLLNAPSPWRCTPESVKALFESEKAHAAWLAFEVPHVQAILSRVESLLNSHRIQAAVSRVSDLPEDQIVGDMYAMSLEIREAKEEVLRAIETKHVMKTMGTTMLERALRTRDPNALGAMAAALSGGALGSSSSAPRFAPLEHPVAGALADQEVTDG